MTFIVKELSELLDQADRARHCVDQLKPALDSMGLTVRMATALGFNKNISIQPLSLHKHRFKNGVAFEVALGSRRADILAAGGRCVYPFRGHMTRAHMYQL
jgi:hypothetical protein